MSSDDFEVSTGLPDDSCGEEAHQTLLRQSDSVEQARATAYMSGFFDAEGCVKGEVSVYSGSPRGHKFKPSLSLTTATCQMAGVFDGEGCISYEVHSEKRPERRDFYSKPTVSMIQNKEGTILERIYEEYCSHQGVDYSLTYQDARGNRSAAVRANIYGPDDIRGFLTPMLPVLHEKQRQAVIMLREILPRYENGVQLTKEGFIEMMKWKRKLDREKPMGDEDRKYTVEHFEELWADDLEAQQRLDDFGGQSAVSADD
jgi:hypothetical protein